MKIPNVKVSDKVVLHRHWMPADLKGLKPRLKRGRVYCVRYVCRAADGAQYVRLVGVACPVGDCGGEKAILADAFRRVGRAVKADPKQKGGR